MSREEVAQIGKLDKSPVVLYNAVNLNYKYRILLVHGWALLFTVQFTRQYIDLPNFNTSGYQLNQGDHLGNCFPERKSDSSEVFIFTS